MQNEKRIVIIGAGVAGLSAGIYAEQHGFHAILLEKNPSVGGMCTGWYRKGFYLDGCVHWLTGTKEGTFLNEMWKNVDAFRSQNEHETVVIAAVFIIIGYNLRILLF